MKLEEIKKDAVVSGIEPGQVVRIVSIDRVGPDTLTVIYRTAEGTLKDCTLFRSHEANLSLAQAGRHWAFDAPGDAFKLAAEAFRINVAYLFDPMMAVHTSTVEPLPHQITAVYESMLPRQPLRFVLADDPGAGKTIMAGLYIRELVMRADAQRILIVAPGSLVEQWRDELDEKFGLPFTIFSRELDNTSRSGNAFEDHDFLIARLDQLKNNEEYHAKLDAVTWDLVIFDEAHKLSASWYGSKLNETKRFKLGKRLGELTRNLLLMTATPHNGKEEDFQLFLSLLDSDRFYGKFRDGAHKVDVSDIMRRMVKEDLLKFDGTRLFPPRFAYTVNYTLSASEAALYSNVTDYVKQGMNKADELKDGKRRGAVGFALTSLQRRLASSPEAIYQSLRRRLERLKRRLEEEKILERGARLAESYLANVPDSFESADEDLPDQEYEQLETQLIEQATAAQTIQELEAEIFWLEELVHQAQEVRHSGQDKKWEELSKLLQDNTEMHRANGERRKLIIFTEHRDTLSYLTERVRGLLGSEEAVVNIHGGTHRDERRRVQTLFRNDPKVLVLIATDAAGEGVNLQNANLMVNYDLPWNPNRIEQRFGRIHRIGQKENCHLWNLVAAETREGDVFQRLFSKLEIVREALGGRVFDILGEVFENRSLRDLLIDAIRHDGDVGGVREEEFSVEGALDIEKLKAILDRNALVEELMTPERLYEVKEQMERAEARKLQPHFIRTFFAKAFEALGGQLKPREPGRFEISHVPGLLRERDRMLTGRDRYSREPVSPRYSRICFEKQHRDVAGKPQAAIVHPGHPLMQVTVDIILEQHRNKLKQGAVLVDPNDDGTEPRVLFILDHTVRDGTSQGPVPRVVSRRLQFVSIAPDGTPHHAGWAPHLDFEPIAAEDLPLIESELSAGWITGDLEQLALQHATAHLVPEHYEEIKTRRERQVEKTLAAVHERLVKEINYQEDRLIKLKEDVAAGKPVQLNLENVRRTMEDLTARLERRRAELEAQRHIVSAPPLVVGGALVIPAGLLAQRKGHTQFAVDAAARARIEKLAMQAVMDAETALGHAVWDVSAEKCGWDVTARPPIVDGVMRPDRHIEVKGRVKGADTITVTRNEIVYALNQAEKFILAIVLVDGENVEGPFYVRQPFTQAPDWAETSKNLNLSQLLSRAEKPMKHEANLVY